MVDRIFVLILRYVFSLWSCCSLGGFSYVDGDSSGMVPNLNPTGLVYSCLCTFFCFVLFVVLFLLVVVFFLCLFILCDYLYFGNYFLIYYFIIKKIYLNIHKWHFIFKFNILNYKIKYKYMLLENFWLIEQSSISQIWKCSISSPTAVNSSVVFRANHLECSSSITMISNYFYFIVLFK